jgi:hypothetical protein
MLPTLAGNGENSKSDLAVEATRTVAPCRRFVLEGREDGILQIAEAKHTNCAAE